tara:strand:+ start:515 stop:1006 length:492 start_codon:yes stop_codon:yes gene_type:complete
MLTEEFLKDNLITAYFIDNDRENIEMMLRSEDKKSVFSEITPFDEDNEQYKILTKFISLDEIHENTYQKKKDERREFEEEVIRIAKRDGLISDSINNEEYFTNMLKVIVKDESNEDQLFALKLALFEVDKIRDSQNTEIKKKIRAGSKKSEVLLNALKIICEE